MCFWMFFLDVFLDVHEVSKKKKSYRGLVLYILLLGWFLLSLHFSYYSSTFLSIHHWIKFICLDLELPNTYCRHLQTNGFT